MLSWDSNIECEIGYDGITNILNCDTSRYGTLKDVAIAAAKGALIEFAKRHFGDALNYLWKWPF